MTAREPTEWLATQPTISLVPAIRQPMPLGFLARLFGARPRRVVPELGAIHASQESLVCGEVELRWDEPMNVQLSRHRGHGELAVKIRGRAGVIAWRVLAPVEWLETLASVQPKSEHFLFIAVEDMGRLWNAVSWFQTTANRDSLPEWPEPTAYDLARESEGRPPRCTACDSYSVEFTAIDIFRCRECAYEGGEGLARRARDQRKAALLEGDVGARITARWLDARTEAWALREVLLTEAGYTSDRAAVAALRHVEPCLVALDDLIWLYQHHQDDRVNEECADELRAMAEILRSVSRWEKPSLVWATEFLLRLEDTVETLAPDAAPPGERRQWASRPLFLRAVSAMESAIRASGERAQPHIDEAIALLERVSELGGAQDAKVTVEDVIEQLKDPGLLSHERCVTLFQAVRSASFWYRG